MVKSKTKKSKSEKGIMSGVKDIYNDTKFMEGRTANDTIKIWENYREQAMLWRSLSLLQIIVTCVAIISGLYFHSHRKVTLNVPAKPLPGHYLASQIPPSEFISVAEDFVNLIGSYQFKIAERQFNYAAKLLIEPVLTKFQKEMIEAELTTITQFRKSQVFFIDQEETKFRRINQKEVEVLLIGERSKYIAEELQAKEFLQYKIILTTIPRNALNKYGIVVKGIALEKLTSY